MRTLKVNKTKQHGGASLIFVLLITLIITSSTDNAIKSLRNSQEIVTAVNAISHAESGAWAGAEAMRIYLQSLDELSLQALGGDMDIEMDSNYGSVTAEGITPTEIDDENYQIELKIVNRHAAARSSATLQVVYNVNISSGSTTPPSYVPTVRFNDDLNVTGDIELLNDGKPINLTIDGDATIKSISVNPINELHTSGKLTIENSRVTVNSIYSGDDVELSNTVVNKVRTLGDFTADGSATVTDLIANGDITIDASGRFENVSTPKNITVSRGGAGQGILTAGETIVAKQTGSIDSANAVGNIWFDQWFRVGDAVSMANINCVNPYWKNVDSLSANGTLNSCPSSDGSVTAIEGAANTVNPVDPLTPITLTAPDLDVWKVMDDVNYFVEYNTATSQIQVTVNAVNGIPDGTVFSLADYDNPTNPWGPSYKDYLCSTVISGKCTVPAMPTVPLCFGWSLNNRCISYSDGTFKIVPNQTAPGIMFFDGDVELESGHSITTILASGDITTKGNFSKWAANRGGFGSVCEANADHAKYSVRARYTEAYSTHYPTNLCDVDNGTYIPVSIGNIALAAGGVNPDTSINPDASYTGGNIDLGQSTNIWGAVLAGNFLTTSGKVVIKGLVSAGAYGDTSTGRNSLGNSTVIEISATDDYDPYDIPMLVQPSSSSTTTLTSVLTWAKLQ